MTTPSVIPLAWSPYTSNRLLRNELERLAMATFTAGLSFKAVVPSVSVVSKTQKINDLVYSTSSTELERRNNKILKKMGVNKALRLDFFEQRVFTPALATALTEGLQRMGSTSGRELIVRIALGAESELDARYFVQVTEILANYHQHSAPLTRLLLADDDQTGRLIAGVTKAGRLVVPVAVDYLTWRPEMEHRGSLYGFPQRELLIAGRISARAERELSRRGWHIRTRVLSGQEDGSSTSGEQ